jgi:hypothetical protein
MDEQIIADAAVYAKIKAGSLAYYHAHAAEISAKRKELWKLAHPNARPRGRPRKVTAEMYDKMMAKESGSGSSSSSEGV